MNDFDPMVNYRHQLARTDLSESTRRMLSNECENYLSGYQDRLIRDLEARLVVA